MSSQKNKYYLTITTCILVIKYKLLIEIFPDYKLQINLY
jgi:hypothetical protein